MAQKIMIINDSDDFLEVMKTLLEDEGYTVTLSRERPKQDLQDVLEVQPDLIILDLMFGSENAGWKTLEVLKVHPKTQHIPIILCSAAVTQMREVADTLPERGVWLIYKPFDIEEMLTTMRQALQRDTKP